MGFNSAFKGLMRTEILYFKNLLPIFFRCHILSLLVGSNVHCWVAKLFAPYSPASFVYPPFKPGADKGLVSFDVLPSGFATLCYILYAQTVSSSSACTSRRRHYRLRKPFLRLHHLLHKDHSVPQILSQPWQPGCDSVTHTSVCKRWISCEVMMEGMK